MGELRAIVTDLDSCTGCYSCELACKQEYNVPVGERWLRVISVGPKELNGKTVMDFVPTYTAQCRLCGDRLHQGLLPACVEACPYEALAYFDDNVSLLAKLHEGKRVQISLLVGEVPAYA